MFATPHGLQGTKTAPFKQPLAKPRPLGPEHNPWYWHPGRVEARVGPPLFMAKLAEIDPNLSVTWNPITERWQVWVRASQVQNPLCQGWRLLFIHWGATHQYLPLDERVFARVYQVDGTHQGNAKSYFQRIEAEFNRDRERKDREWSQDTLDRAMPSFEYSQIKNIGLGSKFSTYHS